VLQPKAIVKEMLDFIADESNCFQFFEFVKSQHSEENLEFYLEVQLPLPTLPPPLILSCQVNKLHEVASDSDSRTLSQSIFRDFLSDTAPRMINVEGRLVRSRNLGRV